MIRLEDSPLTACAKLGAGNPGATIVCAKVLAASEDPLLGFIDLCHMDDMGLQGAAIWCGFNDHCESDLERFIVAIRTRDPAMVATIQQAGHYATQYGPPSRL